jgi:DNA topoisomerase III
MSQITILAEKPSQAKAYAEAFSNTKKHNGYIEIPPCNIFKDGAKITWGIGHLVTLKEPHEYEGKEEWKNWRIEDLPLVPPSFQFKVSPKTKPQFNIVKKLIQSSDLIIIATDCDREGENIAQSIISLSGGKDKPTKRLWINSLEEDEVRKGFQNLKDGSEFYSYYEEAQARQIGDWLVGLNASRLYTLLLQSKGIRSEGAFSCGRVQTPTLKLIYDRQLEIKNFKPEPFFELESKFNVETGHYIGKYKGKYTEKIELQNLLEHHQISPGKKLKGKIVSVVKEEKKKKPPKLHSLSSLQSLANKKFKYSPSKVLKVVQELYDSPLKLVSYPRTDTQYITDSEFRYLKQNLMSYQKINGTVFEPYSLEPDKRYVNNEKVQEHYAIIPTKTIPTAETINALTKEQKDIYFEIIQSAISIFHEPYVYEETKIITEVNQLKFDTTGTREVKLGWKEVIKEESKSKDQPKLLPNVTQNMECESDVFIKEGITSPPKPYTEGQLINLMKTCGKGINELGEEEKAVLKEVEGLGTEATRSNIIETLKKQNYIEIKKNIVHVTKKGEILCKVVTGTLLSKPEMTAKWESYLKQIGQKQGDKNKFIASTVQFTKDLVDKTKSSIKEKNLDKEVSEISTQDQIALCPSCKKGYIVDRKKFYGCSNYKDGCSISFSKKILEKNITENQIKQICEKGKTSRKIKGFKGKKTFDAYLTYIDGKLKFEVN